MTQQSTRKGQCLCGAVTITVPKQKQSLGACHCIKCRRWSGGPLLEIECGTDVSFTGEANITTFASSDWAQRGFCKICGSHLFVKANKTGEYGIPPGLFDDCQHIEFDRQVFYDQKPDYLDFANHTNNICSDYIYQHFPETKEQ